MTDKTPNPVARTVAVAPATPAELKRLYDERKALNARIRAAKSKARTEARTLRNRHGILTGLAALAWLEAHPNPAFAEQLQRARDWWLKKPEERALFGLAPLVQPPSLVVDHRPASVAETKASAEQKERQQAQA